MESSSISGCKLSDRLKALEKNQDKWKSRISGERRHSQILENTLSAKSLESRRSELIQSSEEWRKRVRTPTVGSEEDAVLQRPSRIRRSPPMSAGKENKNETVEERKQDDVDELRKSECPKIARSSPSIIQNLSENLIVNTFALNDAREQSAANTEERVDDGRTRENISLLPNLVRRICPTAARRLPTRFRQVKSVIFQGNVLPADQQNHRLSNQLVLGVEYQNEQQHKTPKTPQLQFQLPQIGVDRCGVRLRNTDELMRYEENTFPELMLLRATGAPNVSVRLVQPNHRSIQDFASYLLIGADHLIVYNGAQSNVSERTKVSQIAYEIIAGKEVPRCSATRVQIANDDSTTERRFWRLLSKFDEVDDEIEVAAPFGSTESEIQEVERSEDAIYEVCGQERIELISRGVRPTYELLDPRKVLIFYFVSEVYVWAGKNSNKSLMKAAMDHAKILRDTPSESAKRLVCCSASTANEDFREWTLIRRFNEGVVDCLFRHKFGHLHDHRQQAPLSAQFLTPLSALPRRSASSVSKRPQSVPCQLLNRTHSLLASTPTGPEDWLKDEDTLATELAKQFLASKQLPPEPVLQLEGIELRHSDDNVFTEGMIFYELKGEELEALQQPVREFKSSSCYVIEWLYRVERGRVHKLDGSASVQHETGRQRKAFFYWLGRNSSTGDRSRCALALRNMDKDRCEHIRMEQGNEPPMFLHLLGGKMIVKGSGTGTFLVVGSVSTLMSAEELENSGETAFDFRSQGAYLQIEDDHLKCLYGEDCPKAVVEGANQLAIELASIRSLSFDSPEQMQVRLGSKVPWKQAPRLYRIYENEGNEIICPRYHPQMNFGLRQSEIRNCVLVDQGTHLWVWSEETAPTFALKVAFRFWYGLEFSAGQLEASIDRSTSTVISGGAEPEDFKALFPTWTNDQKSANMAGEPELPQPLCDVIHERTRHRSLAELRERKLPKGCDSKHLENYLDDSEFRDTFQVSREDFRSLPRWKQITLKKEALLF